MSQLRKSAKVCVKCSSSSDLNQFKIVKKKPEILLIVFERNRNNFQTKTSKYIDSRVKIERDLSIFRSISETGGGKKMCKPTFAVTRSGGKNMNMGHFISYVFTEDEKIMYDYKAVTRKIDENLSSNVKFQRKVCPVTYCLHHSQSIFLVDQANKCETFDWNVTAIEDEYILKSVTDESEVNLAMVRLESLKTLYHQKWVHSEAMMSYLDLFQRRNML